METSSQKVGVNLQSEFNIELRIHEVEVVLTRTRGFRGRAFAISVCSSVCPFVHLFVTLV